MKMIAFADSIALEHDTRFARSEHDGASNRLCNFRTRKSINELHSWLRLAHPIIGRTTGINHETSISTLTSPVTTFWLCGKSL